MESMATGTTGGTATAASGRRAERVYRLASAGEAKSGDVLANPLAVALLTRRKRRG